MKKLSKIANKYLKKIAEERPEAFLISPKVKLLLGYWLENRPELKAEELRLIKDYENSLDHMISGVKLNKRIEIIYPLYKAKEETLKKVSTPEELVNNPDLNLVTWQFIILKNLAEALLTEEKTQLEMSDKETQEQQRSHGLI